MTASGAYDEKPSQKSERHVSDEQKKRFLKESEKLFSLLSIEPHPSTVQHVVDTLQSLLDIDPRTVFLRIVNFVKAGKDEGYQYESLAVDLIVRVVNRVFADFRPMLQEHQDTRDASIAADTRGNDAELVFCLLFAEWLFLRKFCRCQCWLMVVVILTS